MTLLAEPLDPAWRRFAPPEWCAHWQPQRLALAGGEIEGVEMGAGPPLVLLPPLPGWKEAYVALAPRLAARHRVLACDLRTRGPEAGDWDALVADASRLARERFGEPVAVFGHSLGAALALRWALARPAEVKSLVLSSGFARVFTPPGALRRRWLEQPLALAAMRLLPDRASAGFTQRLAARGGWVFDRHGDAATVEMVRFGVRHTSLARVRACIRLAFAHDVRARLGEVRVPTCVIAGERDTEFARASAAELAAGIPGASRRTVAEAGHLHPLSRPDALAEAVLGWLSGGPREMD